jgi:hypothetical protein
MCEEMTKPNWKELFSKLDNDELFDVCEALSNYLIIVDWFAIGWFETKNGDEISHETYMDFLEYVRGDLCRTVRDEMAERWDGYCTEYLPSSDDDEDDDDDDNWYEHDEDDDADWDDEV